LLGNAGVKLFSINGAELLISAIYVQNLIGYSEEVSAILTKYYTD
jgi:hypothetical protein